MDKIPDESDAIRRIVALKRYETPPPGYFRGFSSRVIAQIEREERDGSQPWWSRLGSFLQWRPALPGANALIVAGLGLLAGAAVFIQKSRPGRAVPRLGQGDFAQTSAGVDLHIPASPANLVGDQPIVPYGLRYQIQIIAADSNQIPTGLFGQPQFPILPVGLPDGR